MASFFETYKPVPLGEILHRSKPEWLVDQLMVDKTFGIIFGKPGVGKTFLATDLAVAIASGGEFFGRQCARRKVFLFYGEGGTMALVRSLAAIEARGVNAEELPSWLEVFPAAPTFMDFNELSAADIKAFEGSVVIIDNLGTAAPGFSLNDEEDAREIAAAARRFIDRCGAQFILIHHEPKAGEGQSATEYGSVYIRAALDWSLRVHIDSEDRYVLEASKQRDTGGVFKEGFQLYGVPIVWPDGEEQEVAALRWSGEPYIGSLDRAALDALQRIVRPGQRFTSGAFKGLKGEAYDAVVAAHGAEVADAVCRLKDRPAKSCFARLAGAGKVHVVEVAESATAYYELMAEAARVTVA
jgi:KaiC/GvpD/RAD55 family RecA-like ATPase